MKRRTLKSLKDEMAMYRLLIDDYQGLIFTLEEEIRSRQPQQSDMDQDDWPDGAHVPTGPTDEDSDHRG